MNRTHAEPARVTPKRCETCLLPFDVAQRARVEHRAAHIAADVTWHFCEACGESTCPALRRICEEEAGRG